MTEGTEVTFSAVWDSVNSIGFWTGFILAFAVVFLLLLALLWRWLRHRHDYLTISEQEGSEFKISLRAVKTHLASYIARAYPRLQLQGVRLRSCRGGLRAVVNVKARCGEDMQVLSHAVMKDIQNSLNRTMGLGELFTRVDVIVCSLQDEKGKSDSPAPAGGLRPLGEVSRDHAVDDVKPLQPLADEERSPEKPEEATASLL